MKKVVKLTLVGYLDFDTGIVYKTKDELIKATHSTEAFQKKCAKAEKTRNTIFTEALLMAFIAHLRKQIKYLIKSIDGWNCFEIWAKIGKLKDLIVEAKYELFFGKKTNLI